MGVESVSSILSRQKMDESTYYKQRAILDLSLKDRVLFDRLLDEAVQQKKNLKDFSKICKDNCD